MHQLLCGVEEAVFVDGYRIEILEVTPDAVRLGLSMPGRTRTIHEVKLPAVQTVRPASRWQSVPTRPTVN